MSVGFSSSSSSPPARSSAHAVTWDPNGVNIETVGLILMIVGIVGLVISLAWMATAASRTRDVPSRPPPPPVPSTSSGWIWEHRRAVRGDPKDASSAGDGERAQVPQVADAERVPELRPNIAVGLPRQTRPACAVDEHQARSLSMSRPT